jgi:glycosyltransferase involved in cell wall biosynthesis
LQRIVREEGCGLVFESGNAEELAECVIRLHDDPDLRAEMGANGRRAVLEKYNWDAASKELVRMYEGVAQVHDGVAG